MPRSNRSRRRRDQPEAEPLDLSRILLGARRVEERHDGRWNVQPVPAASALKEYTCPGCGLRIAVGTEHLVAWRADGILGDENDLAARRHWHLHCWRTAR